ncbi:hypothetical protein [Pseudaestuariivita rosea]|uniref:hypothetical protein n=1 Tax=Pseudaestuariivita rosea TaxID=2763263 RepID=UPI001ABA10EB|nr:hypothetical protein [Pseudaestuariivita rosea]
MPKVGRIAAIVLFLALGIGAVIWGITQSDFTLVPMATAFVLVAIVGIIDEAISDARIELSGSSSSGLTVTSILSFTFKSVWAGTLSVILLIAGVVLTIVL